MNGAGKFRKERITGRSSREEDITEIAQIVTKNHRNQGVTEFLISFLEKKNQGYQWCEDQIHGITKRKDRGKPKVNELLCPDTGLNSKQKSIGSDKVLMDVVRIHKMNRVVQVGINGDGITEGKTVPQQTPLGLVLGNQPGEDKHYQHRHQASHPAGKAAGDVSLRLKKEVGFEGEVGDGEQKEDGNKLLEPEEEDDFFNSPFYFLPTG